MKKFTSNIDEMDELCEKRKRIQTFKTLGIVWIALGGMSRLFFLVGFAFIISSVFLEKKVKKIESASSGGVSR